MAAKEVSTISLAVRFLLAHVAIVLRKLDTPSLVLCRMCGILDVGLAARGDALGVALP